MKIGVISDTHLDKPTPLLEHVVRTYFGDAEIILHAGDLHRRQVLDVFRGKTLYVVAGNRDDGEVKKWFPERHIIETSGYRIGLVHGWGPPFGINKRVATCFSNVDCIVFGHSHRPFVGRKNGILLFNPGAFCGGIFSLWKRNIGILTLDGEIRAEVIRIT